MKLITSKSEDIIKSIENFDYVSFDIFDTLIFRFCSEPTDIFDYVGELLKKKGIDIIDFKQKRKDAQTLAIKKHCEGEEVSLREIYDVLQIDEEIKEEVKEAELETEFDFCKLNRDMMPVLEFCEKHNKHIIITSDMYLPKVVIEKILYKNKIIYEHLYLSSDIGLRKSSYNLYRYLLGDLGISKEEIIHIGDNKVSDFLQPMLHGMEAILYKCSLNDTGGDLFKIGYGCLGPLVFGFNQWVHKEFHSDTYDKLYFFARDGYVMQKAYSLMYPADSSEYLYVSRRCLTVPLLKEAKNFQDIVKIVPYIKRIETWDTLLHKLGIEDEAFQKDMELKYGHTIFKAELLSDEKYSAVFDDLKVNMFDAASKESNEAHLYLDEKFLSKRILGVDIGWYGTIQFSLENFFKNQSISLTGLYMGLLERNISRNRRMGYVYDYNAKSTFDASLIFGFNGLIESFFTANHGSAKKFSSGKAILEVWEEQNWNIVERVHEGALAFCKDYAEIAYKYNLEQSPQTAYKSLERLLTRPTSREIKALRTLVFFDAYYEPIVKYTHSRLYYFIHPKIALNDFMKSNWKIGFLSCLTGLYGTAFPRLCYKIMNKLK